MAGDWFAELTGFAESDYASTQARLLLDGERLVVPETGRSWQAGRLKTPSLAELRERAQPALAATRGTLQVSNIAADAYALHTRPEVCGAVVQVASQFNLLEMTSPDLSPEDGLARYQFDRTQGPACAMAAGAGTIVRNYLADVPGYPGQKGQTRERQIDTLADLRAALPGGDEIRMRNGYAMAGPATLRRIDAALAAATPAELDALRGRLRIGLHWHTQVTAVGAPAGQWVTQAYCSALPVAYNRGTDDADWARLGQLVLEAAYEATLLAAVLQAAQPGGNPRVYLTQLGGGAFGNQRAWIHAALRRGLDALRGQALQVSLVSYGRVPTEMVELVAGY